ncbi:MAG TPA: response regulator transcription factor [Actinopolymorphaceae bacterium]|jgi:DNA-binding NarL/FixJ family response regulator
MTIRVVVVDDHAIVRTGFEALLAAQDDIDVVGSAANGVEAVDAVRKGHPDVVVMDVRMPEMDGLEAARIILGEGGDAAPKIVMLTTFDIDDYVYEALRIGASGFLLKDALPADLVAAVRIAAAGEALLAPKITRRLISEFVRRHETGPRRKAALLEQLTGREREVLTLIARGLSNAEIADELVVAEQTVKTHVSRIFAKLNLRDRAQAVVLAYESGLVSPDQP